MKSSELTDPLRARATGAVIRSVALAATLFASPGTATASVFDVSISPPRFELKAKPGDVVREIIRITNNDRDVGKYIIKTADWELTEKNQLVYHEDAPIAGSCRPWVRIERYDVSVPAQAVRSYRFEVHVPKDTPSTECRLALLVAPDPATVAPVKMGRVNIPVVGRIAVTIYLAVGDAKAALSVERFQVRMVNNKPVPFVTVRNVGTAHGRLFGALSGTDATGRTVELVADRSPVLPGRTAEVGLRPVNWGEGGTTDVDFVPKPPLRLKGKLEWDGGAFDVKKELVW